MTTLLVFLFVLLPPAAIGWIVWSYRRKASQKKALSGERAAILLNSTPRPSPAGQAGPAGSPNPGNAAAGRPAVGPAPAAPSAMARERFLSQPETLMYYLLKSGLPGHEVFPRVTLGAVLTLTGARAAGAPDDVRLAGHELDFVVCDKGLRVVAAVRLAGRLVAGGTDWADGCLAAAGIRLVRMDPKAPPKREQVPGLVVGTGG